MRSRFWLVVCKILVALLLAGTAIVWARFFSWGFIDVWYQTKVDLPLIPALGILFTVLWLLFDKSAIVDRLRLRFDAWFSRSGAVTIMSLVVVFGVSLCLYLLLTPPRWKQFIDNELLSGHDDQFYRARLSASEIKTRDRDTGLLAEVATRLEELSEEESKWVSVATQEELFVLQKRITSAEVPSQFAAVLKNFSEANLKNIALEHKAVETEASTQAITDALGAILEARKRYTTRKLRNVVAKVWANTHYFAGNMEEAVQGWEMLPRTPSTLANLVVGYRELHEYQTSLQCGLEGLDAYDAAEENAAQTLGSLVANTMTTLMCGDDYSGAIELYQKWYTQRGELSDSALVQTYAINLILADRDDEAQNLMTAGRMAQDEVEDLELLILMKANRYEEATALLRNLMGTDAEDTTDGEIWEWLKGLYDDAGYLGSPTLQHIFDQLLQQADQKQPSHP